MNTTLLVSETYLNATEGYTIGESGTYEPFTSNIGRLFRAMQREYGRCVSSVYVDGPTPESTPRKVGWVFQGQLQYEDTKETYVREVWVMLHDAPDTVVRSSHFHSLEN